jgi:hypothetical protein
MNHECRNKIFKMLYLTLYFPTKGISYVRFLFKSHQEKHVTRFYEKKNIHGCNFFVFGLIFVNYLHQANTFHDKNSS